MMPKIGDKYIIEIDRIYSSEKHGESRFGIKGFEDFVLSKRHIDRLLQHGNIKPLSEYDAECYQRAYAEALEFKRGVDDTCIDIAYRRGMTEAWDIAKKMLTNKPSMYCKDMAEILDKLTPFDAKLIFTMFEEEKAE